MAKRLGSKSKRLPRLPIVARTSHAPPRAAHCSANEGAEEVRSAGSVRGRRLCCEDAQRGERQQHDEREEDLVVGAGLVEG